MLSNLLALLFLLKSSFCFMSFYLT